jgi:hypothetical protein
MYQIITLGVSLIALTLWSGAIYLTFTAICSLWDAHQRGMKRLRAYDRRTAQLNK